MFDVNSMLQKEVISRFQVLTASDISLVRIKHDNTSYDTKLRVDLT